MNSYRPYDQDLPRIQLDHFSRPRKKYLCPECSKQGQKRKTFTRYIDIVTGEEIGENFGKCDRVVKCGCHNVPSFKDIGDKPLNVSPNNVKGKFVNQRNYSNCIPGEKVISTIGNYSANGLFKFLSNLFGYEHTMQTFLKYKIGTTDQFNWKGCAIFWQLDQNMIARTGKIMEYRPIMVDGKEVDIKRYKDGNGFSHIYWVHSDIAGDYKLCQCLFGAHLLPEKEGTKINVVESEKTAIICSLNKPNQVWMATGGMTNLREETFMLLKNYEIILYPDKGCWTQWNDKIKTFPSGFNITVSNVIENLSNLKDGEDIADVIIKKKLKENG